MEAIVEAASPLLQALNLHFKTRLVQKSWVFVATELCGPVVSVRFTYRIESPVERQGILFGTLAGPHAFLLLRYLAGDAGDAQRD